LTDGKKRTGGTGAPVPWYVALLSTSPFPPGTINSVPDKSNLLSFTEGSTARIGGAVMIIFGIAAIYVDQKARLRKKKAQKNEIEPEH